MANLDRATLAQYCVIGSLLIDDRCAPLVVSKLTPEDFIDPTCRNFFTVIRELVLEGRRVDPVPVLGRLKSGDDYVGWVRDVMEITPTAANVEEYIPEVQRAARRRRILGLAGKLPEADDDEMEALVRQMASALSATERMPRMTGPELAADFLRRMQSQEKPRYLPWGIPTADRATYAELGDIILLGGYASSGKTLLSIHMAMEQAKAGYKVGYYSLETTPEKLADRMFASLANIPLSQIKTRQFSEGEWGRSAEAANTVATVCPFDITRAAGYTVDDITADAVGHGYQVVYVDYVQLLRVSGMRDSDRYAQVTAVSQRLKAFAQSTNTAVVALAQLSRPYKEKGESKYVPPSMHSFRESGQLEQDADVAFLVYPSDPNDNASNRVFKIGKNKEGPRLKTELVFHGGIQTMTELAAAPDRPVAAEMSSIGRAAKQANRANGQVAFRELRDGDEDNPFS